ncbi:MAG: LysM peptidoglycan-binding domain-containing protein [Actinomycetia bacterium]|jgi:LysM repeat protein|nr:LysM peptidoglycan-binding domain-containing protein [Actinomycetes bacterium]
MSSTRSTATAAPGPVRLTRRGRLVVVLALVALTFLAAAAFGRAASQAGTDSAGPATRAITVQLGDTLWGIAVDVAPETDPRATIERLRDLNDLGTDVVQAGQRLVVPA